MRQTLSFLRVLPEKGIDKTGWYRLSEREHTNYRADKSLLHKYIRAKRIIVRAGYFFEPTDMSSQEAVEIAKQKLFEHFDWLSEERYNSLLSHLNIFEEKFFSQIRYELRGQWANKKRDEFRGNKEYFIRTFWYRDLKEPIQPLRVSKIETKKIGEGGQENNYDESYSWFSQFSSHQLYKIYDNTYIHPEDIIE